MTLAAIVGVCLLTAAPSARPQAAPAVLAAVEQQDSTPGNAQRPSVEPRSTPTREEQTSQPANSSPDKASNPKVGETPTRSSSPPDRAQPQKDATARPAQSKHESVKGKSATSAARKSKRKRGEHSAAHAPAGPPKVVVKNGGTTDPLITISPGVNQQQASNQRQHADQLLARADANLKKISGRPLNSNQQEMVKQIQQYMEQAKAAAAAGDLTRQNNLALKAQLLSEELAKP